MGFSIAQRNSFIDTLLGGTIYIALFTTNPTSDDGSGSVEVSGGSYARILFSDWVAASNGQASNNTEALFAQASANWGNVKGFGLYSAIIAGTFQGWGALTAAKDVDDTEQARFQAGELDVNFDTP